jgi:hypothetical protein
MYLRTVHGEKAEAKVDEEFAKLAQAKDPSAVGPIIKAIVKAKNVHLLTKTSDTGGGRKHDFRKSRTSKTKNRTKANDNTAAK